MARTGVVTLNCELKQPDFGVVTGETEKKSRMMGLYMVSRWLILTVSGKDRKTGWGAVRLRWK